MKNSVSIFEKVLISIICFSFCAIVLVQIFVNNDVLDTIKANEKGTAVEFKESSAYISNGYLTLSISGNTDDIVLMINGEELEDKEIKQTLKIDVYDGDVVEVNNYGKGQATVHVVNSTANIISPKIGNKQECNKGINYLYKIQLSKIS